MSNYHLYKSCFISKAIIQVLPLTLILYDKPNSILHKTKQLEINGENQSNTNDNSTK
jgi:hypothetical protein